MQKKKIYIQPTVELYPTELSATILGGSRTVTGYAIDNTAADDSNIIPISEQSKDENIWDTFVDVN